MMRVTHLGSRSSAHRRVTTDAAEGSRGEPSLLSSTQNIDAPAKFISVLSLLGWLILCANLPGLRDFQTAGKIFFLGVSVKMFLEEMSIWVSKLNKEDHPHQCGWASSNWLRAWIEKNRSVRRVNSLSTWAEISIFWIQNGVPSLPPHLLTSAKTFFPNKITLIHAGN